MTSHETAFRVVRAVADVFQVDHADILGRSTKRRFSEPRAACYTILRDEFRWSQQGIGDEFDRLHETVLVVVRNYRARMASDPQLAAWHRLCVEAVRREPGNVAA